MKKKNLIPIALLSIVALFAVSCDKSDPSDDIRAGEPLALLQVSPEGVTRALVNNICPILEATDPLTADEIEFLYALREDEKLSKDLYNLFAGLYPASLQFANTAAAEATHVAAVEKILAYYEIEYPVLGEAGVFADPGRQARYDELAAGATTLVGAFMSMATLEEGNVAAYKAVEASIANVNIRTIVSNMLKSASNHLQAAVRQITALGGVYTPSILDQAEFDNIVQSNFSQGNKYGQQSGGKGNNTNSAKAGNQQGLKGSVDCKGICTGTCNGVAPGTSAGVGQAGKGYRGGK